MVRECDEFGWGRARDLLREAEELQSRLCSAATAACAGLLSETTSAVPAVNLLERGVELRVVAALPGVEADELEVRIENGWLVLAGRRSSIVVDHDARPLLIEVPRGPFERRVRLPSSGGYVVDSTRWSKGLLLLELRRSS